MNSKFRSKGMSMENLKKLPLDKQVAAILANGTRIHHSIHAHRTHAHIPLQSRSSLTNNTIVTANVVHYNHLVELLRQSSGGTLAKTEKEIMDALTRAAVLIKGCWVVKR